jgi:hypothetical protein
VVLRRLLQVQSPALVPNGSAETVPPAQGSGGTHTRVSTIIIAVVVSVVSTLILALVAFCIYRRRMMRKISAVRERPFLNGKSGWKRWGTGDESLPGSGAESSADVSVANPILKENIRQGAKRLPDITSRSGSLAGSDVAEDGQLLHCADYAIAFSVEGRCTSPSECRSSTRRGNSRSGREFARSTRQLGQLRQLHQPCSSIPSSFFLEDTSRFGRP